MVQHITAIYDGHNLTLEHPLNIPVNSKIRISIDLPDAGGDLFQMVVKEAKSTGRKDWSRNHDHYIYGSKKRGKVK